MMLLFLFSISISMSIPARFEMFFSTFFVLQIWMLYKTLFKGESCVDTTIFDDKKGDRWLLFTNKSNDKYNDHNSELYIYKTDRKFNKLIPHKLNPLITDSRFAWNACNIYYNKQGFIMRPSQMNTHNLYGGALNIRIIKILNLYEFNEVNCNIYYPNFKSNISAIDHITQNNHKYIIDYYIQIFNNFS